MTGPALYVAPILVGALVYLGARCSSSADLRDSRATAVAVWYAWNELDCDDPDLLPGAVGCEDEAQDANRPPLVERIRHKPGRTIVYLLVRLKGGATGKERLTVDDRTEQVVAAGSYP